MATEVIIYYIIIIYVSIMNDYVIIKSLELERILSNFTGKL